MLFMSKFRDDGALAEGRAEQLYCSISSVTDVKLCKDTSKYKPVVVPLLKVGSGVSVMSSAHDWSSIRSSLPRSCSCF